MVKKKGASAVQEDDTMTTEEAESQLQQDMLINPRCVGASSITMLA